MTRRRLLKHALVLFPACVPPPLLADKTAPMLPTGANLVAAARRQVGRTLTYDPAYVVLPYPMGDVPEDRGVCADVVIRALRACGVDLQQAVHEDMKSNFSAYPKIWGLRRTDRNIDHRRVLNLAIFLKRRGASLPVTREAVDYRPGDFVTCTVAGKLPHIMMVSDRRHAEARPLIVHNIGQGAREEDRLFEFPLNGHFRWR
jgi:uncharacterized protein YijF (DUF1287 family)